MGKAIDITGNKYCKLTALNRVGTTSLWSFQCDCGNIKDILRKNVVKEGAASVKSCGCSKSNWYADYTGQKYNMLTIGEYTGTTSKWGNRIYKVTCDCGNTKELVIGDVVSGKTKSCGCLTGKNEGIVKDMIGQTCGSLSVVKKLPVKKNDTYWICKCSCGNSCEVRGTFLRNGKTLSCGCRKRGSKTHGTIYGIYDNNNVLMYIGQTVHYKLEERLRGHLKDAKGNMKDWLVSIDYVPNIKALLDNQPIEYLDRLEKRLIESVSKEHPILNVTYNLGQGLQITIPG